MALVWVRSTALRARLLARPHVEPLFGDTALRRPSLSMVRPVAFRCGPIRAWSSNTTPPASSTHSTGSGASEPTATPQTPASSGGASTAPSTEELAARILARRRAQEAQREKEAAAQPITLDAEAAKHVPPPPPPASETEHESPQHADGSKEDHDVSEDKQQPHQRRHKVAHKKHTAPSFSLWQFLSSIPYRLSKEWEYLMELMPEKRKERRLKASQRRKLLEQQAKDAGGVPAAAAGAAAAGAADTGAAAAAGGTGATAGADAASSSTTSSSSSAAAATAAAAAGPLDPAAPPTVSADTATDSAAPPADGAAPADSDIPSIDTLVRVEDKKTMWARRVEAAADRIRNWQAVVAARKVRGQLRRTQNPIIAVPRDLQRDLKETVEDLRETIETSQHPLVWKVRDAHDRIFSETDTAFALGEIKKMDPDFRIDEFLKEMEEYMIPVVVEAFLKPDMDLIRAVCAGEALKNIAASYQARLTAGLHFDTRILDISHVDMVGATVVKGGVPVIQLTFMCQHVHCVKNKDGKIVEGSEATVHTIFYHWLLQRDLESQDFDWKIMEWASQRVYALQ